MTVSVRGLLAKLSGGVKCDPLVTQIDAATAQVAQVELQVQLKKALIDLVTAQHRLEKSWQETVDLRDQLKQHAQMALQLPESTVYAKCQAQIVALECQIDQLAQQLREVVKHRATIETRLLGQTSIKSWAPPVRASAEPPEQDEEALVSGAFFAAAPIVTTRSRPSALAERLILA